ncbi:MAG: HAD family phosphatase [Candidatus Binatia bacterium]
MFAGPRALVFDFDGIIVDSEPLHLAAFQRTLATVGITLTAEEYWTHYLGFDDHDAIAHALTTAHGGAPPADVARLMHAKAEHFLALVEHGVSVFPGVRELVRGAAARVPLAIASGALGSEIELILRAVGLRDAFRTIVSANDVQHGKPDPEAYVAALAHLRADVAPELVAAECLAVEDSPAGIAAARAAGMRCVAVTNSCPARDLAAAGADLVVASLEGVGWERLAGLFGEATPR